MRIEPTPPSPPSGNFSSGGGLSAAAEAVLFSQLASVAPTTSPQAVAATGQQMTQQQINTYWLFRAMSDFAMLALVQNPQTYPSTAYQPYLNDLKYILGQSNPPLQLDPSIMKDLTNYTTGTNYTTIPANFGTILTDFQTIMGGKGVNPGNYDFNNFTQDSMFYFYTFQTAYALQGSSEGSEIKVFWNSNGQTSPMGTSMGQFITTYFYERNLNPDGTLNKAGLTADLNAFQQQFDPRILSINSGTFQQNYPDIYNMLNGGIDQGGTPYAGLNADFNYFIFNEGAWPFAGHNVPPIIPLQTPPPPWDNPNPNTPPVFIYPTNNNDPACAFFLFVDNFLSDFFQNPPPPPPQSSPS